MTKMVEAKDAKSRAAIRQAGELAYSDSTQTSRSAPSYWPHP